MTFYGVANDTALFLQREHLCNEVLWRKFVDVFREKPDSENGGWRGEFWGKMMRGAALVYEYTRDEELYRVLTESVRDLLTVAEQDGRVSSYEKENDLFGWDVWGRKYVLLGCEYYLDICHDDALKGEILAFCIRLTDDIMAHVGEDKKRITDTSLLWYGLNSSSLLEPVVILYRLTGEARFLNFAAYIVNEGGAKGINIFEAAYENRLLPYEYGVSKAYELTSCFEGLLEYYKLTGIEKHKTAVLNYAKAILSSELSIIGGCGITHELFDHTSHRQTVEYTGAKQETCVTVTLMKFFARLLELTDDTVFADAIEHSFYNAYLGALNTEHKESAYVKKFFEGKTIVPTNLPFDSYSPLTPAKRGIKVGGLQLLTDTSYYGCCACIAAAGVGVFLKQAVTVKEDTVTINFYEKGQVSFEVGSVPVTLEVETDYPTDGRINIRIRADRPVKFTLKLRRPGWTENGGYDICEKIWKNDTVKIKFDMQLRTHFPEEWEEDTIYTDTSECTEDYFVLLPQWVRHEKTEEYYVAVTRGPLTLAADSRTGKAASSVFPIPKDGTLCEANIASGIPCLLKMRFVDAAKNEFYLVDYSSAGKDWETEISAWLRTK